MIKEARYCNDVIILTFLWLNTNFIYVCILKCIVKTYLVKEIVDIKDDPIWNPMILMFYKGKWDLSRGKHEENCTFSQLGNGFLWKYVSIGIIIISDEVRGKDLKPLLFVMWQEHNLIKAITVFSVVGNNGNTVLRKTRLERTCNNSFWQWWK